MIQLLDGCQGVRPGLSMDALVWGNQNPCQVVYLQVENLDRMFSNLSCGARLITKYDSAGFPHGVHVFPGGSVVEGLIGQAESVDGLKCFLYGRN